MNNLEKMLERALILADTDMLKYMLAVDLKTIIENILAERGE